MSEPEARGPKEHERSAIGGNAQLPLFRGSSFESMYSRPSGPIAVTCVTYSPGPGCVGSPTSTASRASGGNAGNGFQSMSSGRIDLKFDSPGWWGRTMATLLPRGATCYSERQTDVILGERRLRGARRRKIVEFRALHLRLEARFRMQPVEEHGHPPGEALRLPHTRKGGVTIGAERRVVLLCV